MKAISLVLIAAFVAYDHTKPSEGVVQEVYPDPVGHYCVRWEGVSLFKAWSEIHPRRMYADAC